MDDKLTLQIDKLGHELEEIRVRALTSIISKLDLGIIKERDLINNTKIFSRLVDWFEFHSVPCRKDVLLLIVRLAQERDGAFYLQVSDPGLSRLERLVGSEFPEELAFIRQHLNDEETLSQRPTPLFEEQLNSDNSSLIQTISSNASSRSQKWEYSEVYWPVPRLDESDARVLSSVTELLADRSQASQVANFFSSVLLHDFPPQVFLHDTSILNALFKLYREEGDNRAILSCFKEFTRSLQRQLKFYEDVASIETVCHVSRDGDDLALCEWAEPSKILSEQLGVGEYCALSLERLGHHLPSALRLLRLVIHEPIAFWEAQSGSFLKSCISNHLMALATKIKAARVSDPLSRIEMQVWLSTVLTTLIPESVASTVIHQQLQSLLYEELFDPLLALVFPKVHQVFKEYVSAFQYLENNNFGAVEQLGESLRAAARLKTGHSKLSTSEILSLLHYSISSLDIHHGYFLISLFFRIVSERNLLPSECELSERILLCLLSHMEEKVQEEAYSELCSLVTKVLGPSAAANWNVIPFDRVMSVLTLTVMKETLYFGIRSPLIKVRKSVETMWTLILKAKLLLSSEEWMTLLSLVTSCFPLLQALASDRSTLGQSVLQMFDPDISSSLNFHKLQVLIANVRLLFSSDHDVSLESYARLVYLLGIAPEVPFVMPDTPLLPHSHTSLSVFSEDNIPRLVEVLSTSDGKMLRSAVVQVGLISEQTSLHIPLLEAGALPLLLDILKSAVELDSEHSRDIYASVILVLKNLAFHNIQIRNDFSIDYDIYTNVLKGLFTIVPERRFVSDAVQLLALMAYSDCITSFDGYLSFPKVLVDHLKLPFHVRAHMITSNYTMESQKSVLQSRKEARVYLGSVWCSALGGGPGSLLSKTCSPPSPLELPSQKAFLYLPTELENSLIDFKTASSHQTATSALNLISRYLWLSEWCSGELEELPWAESFHRYLMTVPASPTDQMLLIEILRVLSQLVHSVKGQVGWVSRYLCDPTNMLSTLLTQTTVEDCSSVRKEMSLELLGLVETCLRLEKGENWDSVSTILLQSLNHSHTQKFYTLAVLDRLLRCLLLLADRLRVPGSQGPLWKLLAAFHCPSNTSFMGLTITRRALFTLNSIIPITKDLKVCEEVVWICKLLASRDWLVVGAALELSSRLSLVPKNLSLLLQHLPQLWDLGLGLLLDQHRSSLVREQAAYLCCNIVNHSQNKFYLTDALEKRVFDSFVTIYVRRKTKKKPEEILTYHSTGFLDESDDFYYQSASTERLITYTCCLSSALMIKDPPKVIAASVKSNFILSLARDTGEWRCEKIAGQETVAMYESVLRVLVQSYSSSCSGYFSAEALQTLVWILLPSSYGDGLEFEGLTVECLRLLALLVPGRPEGELVVPGEAVRLLTSAVCSSNSDLSSAAAAAITVLAPTFSQRGSLDLLKSMGVRDNMRSAVASIVGNSHSAALVALEMGLMSDCLSRLTGLQLSLALTPRNSKKAISVLETLGSELRLLTNFLAGCDAAKEKAANLGLADCIHKLWAWTLTDFNLLSILLRNLITFTADCAIAATTLVLTSTLAGVGQRKSPSSMSLLHAVLASISKEVYSAKVKVLFLELITHACQATECRAVIAKSNVLSEFLNVHSQKKVGSVDEQEGAWLEFLSALTSFPEGQAAIVKNKEAVEKLVDYMAGGRGGRHRGPALGIVRNISFNQTFRRDLLLSTEPVLECVGDLLTDLTLPDDEFLDILLIVWVLSANSQRGRGAVRASGLSSRLDSALRIRPRSDPISSLSELVLPMIQG